MANPHTQGSESISQAEHISPAKTGDNIEAKRSAGYVWNSDTEQWQRAGVGATEAKQDDIIEAVNANFAVRMDTTSTPNVTYTGKAAIGSATSSAVWQIQKIDETTGLVKTWADSNSLFDNVWDNRTSLTYN